MVNQKSAAAANAATPLTVLLVIDNEKTLKIDKESLSKQVAEHLNITQKQVDFYTVEGNRQVVVEEIIARDPHVVLYYKTTAGITTLYMEEVQRRNAGKKCITQCAVNLRYPTATTQSFSLSQALHNISPMFTKAEKNVSKRHPVAA